MPVWLITGGSGFLGRHLLKVLDDQGAPGVDLALLGRQPPWNGSSGEFVATDLNDPAAVSRAIAATAPEVVFHLAGRTPPATADDYYRGNTLATVHLLDALRGLGRAA